MIDLYAQHAHIRNTIDANIRQCIDSSIFIGGDWVDSFRNKLATYLDVNYVIPCANGTDALQLAVMALDLPKESEIIVPNFSFVAPSEVVSLLGYTPVFAEVEYDTFNINYIDIEKKITNNTTAIIAVHLFGQAANMDKIMAIAQQYNLKVIEDNAQSVGATCSYKNKTMKAGTIGDIGTTSFFPTKNLGGIGDGGAVFTQDESLADKIKLLANHGAVQKYNYQMVGVNSRLDNIQAAVLDAKIDCLSHYIEKRKQVASLYYHYLQDIVGVELPIEGSGNCHTYNQFTIKSTNRNQLKSFLASNHIPSMIYYPTLITQQTAYRKYENDNTSKENYRLCDKVLSLPMHTELEEEQIVYICNKIKEGL